MTFLGRALVLLLPLTARARLNSGNVRINQYRHNTRVTPQHGPHQDTFVPGSGAVYTITDYNVSTTGGADVSHIVDTLGRENSHGCVIRFPGGLGAGGAAAGNPPSLYLIQPNTSSWVNLPSAVTLWIEPGALLVTGPGVRVFLGG